MSFQRMNANHWLWAMLLLFLGSSIALAQPGATDGRSRGKQGSDRVGSSDEAAKDAKVVHLREGKKITNLIGYVDGQGDITFRSEDGRYVLGILPNLNMQRLQADSSRVGESRGEKWIISGIVTEYENNNYILLDRVIKKTTASVQVKKPQ